MHGRRAGRLRGDIKLASIFHQYVGAPISPENAESLARTIEEGIRVQPFAENVRVRIDPKRGGTE